MAKRGLSPGTPLEEKGPVVHFLAGVWADICGAIVWVPQVTTGVTNNVTGRMLSNRDFKFRDLQKQ
jgi:hypothetical protein